MVWILTYGWLLSVCYLFHVHGQKKMELLCITLSPIAHYMAPLFSFSSSGLKVSKSEGWNSRRPGLVEGELPTLAFNLFSLFGTFWCRFPQSQQGHSLRRNSECAQCNIECFTRHPECAGPSGTSGSNPGKCPWWAWGKSRERWSVIWCPRMKINRSGFLNPCTGV